LFDILFGRDDILLLIPAMRASEQVLHFPRRKMTRFGFAASAASVTFKLQSSTNRRSSFKHGNRNAQALEVIST
jgi:hypothetical protein